MREIFKKAFIQALEDTLGETPKLVSVQLNSGYKSCIEIVNPNKENKTIWFVASKGFLEHFSSVLLGEENPGEMELRDLSQELANLTIGLAKVIAVGEGVFFDIGTPSVFGYGDMNGELSLDFELNGNKCSIFYV